MGSHIFNQNPPVLFPFLPSRFYFLLHQSHLSSVILWYHWILWFHEFLFWYKFYRARSFWFSPSRTNLITQLKAILLDQTQVHTSPLQYLPFSSSQTPMSPIRGRLGVVGITYGDTGFLGKWLCISLPYYHMDHFFGGGPIGSQPRSMPPPINRYGVAKKLLFTFDFKTLIPKKDQWQKNIFWNYLYSSLLH